MIAAGEERGDLKRERPAGGVLETGVGLLERFLRLARRLFTDFSRARLSR